MSRKKFILIKSRDITLDDLEALSYEYRYEENREQVVIPYLLDHYLAYLVIQEKKIPIKERLLTISPLNIDKSFYEWMLKKHSKDFLVDVSNEEIHNLIFTNPTNSPYKNAGEIFCKVIDRVKNLFGSNQTSLVKFPHVGMEHLSTGILDYFDPIKVSIDPLSDFINLCNSITYNRKKDKIIQPDHKQLLRKNSAILDKIYTELENLELISQKHLKKRVWATTNEYSIPYIFKIITTIKATIQRLNSGLDKVNFSELTNTELKSLISDLEILQDFIIHDHSFSDVFAGEEDINIQIIDFTSNKKPGAEIKKALTGEDIKNVYVFISAMSCEITLGQILGRMFHYLGVNEKRIAFGGMALNSYIPREESDIIEVCQSITGKQAIIENTQQLFHGFNPSLYFGFFDRQGSSSFLKQLFDIENPAPAYGYGIRAGQDGAWIDSVRQSVIIDNSTYTVKAFGLPIFRGNIRAFFVSGSCIHKCDFCASLGSMALSNQRTAQDVFKEMVWHCENMLWLKLMMGKIIYKLRKSPLFKILIGFLNKVIGCNFVFIDDNFRVIHPWTIEYLDEKIRENKMQIDCTTMMDVNTVDSPEHRNFMHRYANGTYLGIEVIREDYIKDFKKTPAKVAIKAFEDKMTEIQNKESNGLKLSSDEKRTLEFNQRLIKANITDRLYKGYLYQLSKLIELGALPMNFTILGVNGHTNMHEVAKQQLKFTQTPLKLFNLFPRNNFDKVLIKLFGNCSVMAEQTMILSIFSGSPDYHNFYPWKPKENDINYALRDLIVPGEWIYDLVRMTSYLTQINYNAFRAINEIENSNASITREKCNPEDVALAYYYLSKSNTSVRNIIGGTIGAFIATYRARTMYPFFWRLVHALKSSVQTSFFRYITMYTSERLAKLIPVMRWKMYRTYIKVPAQQLSPDENLLKKLAHFGIQYVKNNGSSYVKLENETLSYPTGFPKWVYKANELVIKNNQPVIKDDSKIAGTYFNLVYRNISKK